MGMNRVDRDAIHSSWRHRLRSRPLWPVLAAAFAQADRCRQCRNRWRISDSAHHCPRGTDGRSRPGRPGPGAHWHRRFGVGYRLCTGAATQVGRVGRVGGARSGGWLSVPPWLLGLVFLPLAAGSVSFVGGRRVQPYLSILTCAAVTASALLAATEAAAGASDYALGGWAAPLGVRWHVDVLSASMLLTTATIALVVTVFGMSEPAALGRGAPSTWFWPLSLFLVGSLNALFLSGDLFNLYVTLELVTLGAVGLVVL